MIGGGSSRGPGRDLLVALGALTSVTTGGIAAMAVVDGVATGGALVAVGAPGLLAVDVGGVVDVVGWLAVAGGVAAAAWVPGIGRRRRARVRRDLVTRVGDPVALRGVWRRELAAAWTARDTYVDAVAAWEDSPLADRLAGQVPLVDEALVACGRLARSGDDLSRQLRRFGTGRMRRDLLVEQVRGTDGRRADELAGRLGDVADRRAQVQALHRRLEAHVHDLRAAAWRVTALRDDQLDRGDALLAELLDDLDHLRAGLAEVDAPPHRATAVDPPIDRAADPAPRARRGYDG